MHRLPRLAFGNYIALDSARDLAACLKEQNPTRSVSLPDAPRDFRGSISVLQAGDVTFSAFAHTPVTVEAGGAPGNVAMIPCYGSLSFTSKDSRFTARAGHSMALLTEVGNVVETTLDSHVVAPLDPARLLRTARGMLGLEGEARIEMDLAQAREVSTRPAGLPMGQMLEHIFQTMDQLPSANLALLGLDDLFYRYMAVMLSPQVASVFVTPGSERRPPPTRPEVQAVCDYILDHLEQPISLTELELVSGLSARSLQMAFQKQFQCAPMQWLRQARLGLARRRLTTAQPGDTVTRVALDCGFTELGAFSEAYQACFNELPSETLRRALRDR